MTDRPKLYPGHQHQWEPTNCERLTHGYCNHEPKPVRCTVCGFQAPRNVAGLDGAMFHTRECLERYRAYLPCNCAAGQPDQEPA